MNGAILRTAAAGDETALRALWREAFQDEEAVMDAFFDCLFVPEDVLLAESGGRLLSAAYLLRGVRLHTADACVPAAYFYALATWPDCRGRGLGRTITGECIRMAERRGETLCLMPGEESLRGWYAGFSGLRSFGTARELECAACADPALTVAELSAGEYVRLREKLLSGTPHAELPAAFFRFQQALCALSGGALLRLRGADGAEGLACCTCGEGVLFLPELLWTGGAEAAAAALAAHFGLPHCTARLPGTEKPTVMGAGEALRAPLWWGPVFD